MAACLQAIVRGMFEDLRGYKLSYIAAQIKVRSTLQTSESLEWQASARPNARLWWHEQRALVTIFSECRSFWYFLRQKVQQERQQEE